MQNSGVICLMASYAALDSCVVVDEFIPLRIEYSGLAPMRNFLAHCRRETFECLVVVKDNDPFDICLACQQCG